ncbi:hypothetical protein FQN49_002039 [Arthroderma sp. PD_2]|nr:hypothetical protein FQN49_002039 [Arthroderma sp. PD_2]
MSTRKRRERVEASTTTMERRKRPTSSRAVMTTKKSDKKTEDSEQFILATKTPKQTKGRTTASTKKARKQAPSKATSKAKFSKQTKDSNAVTLTKAKYRDAKFLPRQSTRCTRQFLRILQLQSSPGSRLLELPFEIRLEIYYYCIPKNQHVVISSLTKHGNPKFISAKRATKKDIMYYNNSILFVSKQVSEECLNILYGENKFHVILCGIQFSALPKAWQKRLPDLTPMRITAANSQRIRNLIIEVEPHCHLARILGDPAWYPILRHLRRLSIVIHKSGSCYCMGTGCQQYWRRFARSLLKCIQAYLAPETTVEIDDVTMRLSDAFLKKYLVNGYRRVKETYPCYYVFNHLGGPYAPGRLRYYP